MTDDTADAGPPIDPFDARTVSLHGTGDPSSAGGTTAAGRAVPAMPSDPSAIAGFTLLDVIGGGGSGLVMSAEQHRPRRRVAVKFLHRRVGDPIARARFESEADLLARVDHPSIARVFAAGVLAGAPDEPDQPWIAMELVEGGRPITRWADESNLDRAARVRLMEEACEAVHHAHQRGVIHRDLKPANMLVDREGRLRLIDFGIAVDEKDDAAPPASPDGLPLSERPDAAVAGPTTTVGLIGTPGYMSPEQFDGGRDAVDVRTDGYALGVVLFELVTGRLPHVVDEAAADGLLERKRAAATSPASVDPTVDPDLDAVIRTAIAPRREDRYAAVSELADELERWRRGAFVDARPPARPERIGRFVRHHRGAVALSAGGLLLLVAGAGLVTGLWLRSSRALDDLAASQAAEQAQRDRTAAIEEELASLQAAMNEGLPATASTNDGDGTITWPQLLVGDVGKEILEDSAPLVLSAAGDVLEEITDQLSEAESSLERRTLIRSATEQIAALERRIGGSATSDPRLGLQLARTYRTLGDLQGVEWMAGRDDVEPSVPAYRRAAEIIDALRERSPRNPELARASAATNIDLAQALRKIGEFDEAERVARGAVAASEGLLADGNARFAEGRLLVSSLWAQTDAIIGLPRNDEGVATSMEALSRSRSLRGLFGDRPDALSAVAWSALRAGIWSARAERDADVASPILDEGINAVLRWVDAAPEDREPFVAWAAIIGSEHRIIVESPGERSATEAIAVRLQQLSAWYDAPLERADLDDDAAATLANRRRVAHQRMALSLLEVVREGAVSGFSPIASPSDPTALSASDRELAVAIAERMADVVDEMNQAEEAWVIEETGRFGRDARARRGRGSDRRTMDRAAALIVDLDPELAARLGDPRAAAGPARGRLPRGERRPLEDR